MPGNVAEGNPRNAEEGNQKTRGVGGSSGEPTGMPSELAVKNTPPSVPPQAAVSQARKGSDVIEKIGRGERI